MTEQELGVLMLKVAQAEGHSAKFPENREKREPQRAGEVRELIGQGLRHHEVARRLGLSRSRVSQIRSQIGL